MTELVWAALVVALGIVFYLRKARFNYERLPKIPYVAGAAMPSVSIVIPARNEEANIARVLGGLPVENVIVVDDHSDDRTAEVARELGANVIEAPPLPVGALGKPNACLAGALASEGEWLLFADADTHYMRVFLSSLVDYARDEQLDCVSVFLRQERVTWAERILLPYAFALYFTGVSAARVNGRVPSQWLANGQCLLFRRDAYFRIGGHNAVLNSVIEDVALARHAAAQGLKSRVTRAEHMGSVRMYKSFGEIWIGFEKNSFRFLQTNPATGAQVILASILLTSWLPILLLLLRGHHYRHAAIFAVLPTVVLFPWYADFFAALLVPVAIYLFQAVALNGMWTALRGRKTLWKGREV